MSAERNPQVDDSLLAAPLLAITQWTLRAPGTVLIGAVAFAVLSVVITFSGLTFKTNRLDLLNPRSEYNQRWLAYLAEFGDRDDACVVVQADQPGRLQAAIEEMASRLKQESESFDSVFYRRDLTRLKSKALHYLPPEQLAQLQQQLDRAASMAGTQDPAAQLARLNDELSHVGIRKAERGADVQQRYAHVADSLLAVLTNPPIGEASGNTSPATLDQMLPALRGLDAQYLLADKGKLGFVLTRLNQRPSEPSPNAAAIDRLRQIIREVQPRHAGVWIGLTGMPVIEHDEMQASQADMVWTSVASMLLVLLLYLAAYGGLRHAMLVNVLLLFGTAYSFGFVTLAVGHLNILSAAFSAVLIGLGIDFAIHYVASYLNLRRQGCEEQTALLRMAVEVGPGMVTGGVTTAAAFFMAAMTDFVGVRELGLVAGGGILLCVLSTVVLLPPMILLVDRRWPVAIVPAILPAGRWFQFPLRYPRLVMGAFLLGTLVLFSGAARLRYDHNLLNLQPRHLESADIERHLFTRLDDSVWFAVSVCSSAEEVQRRKAAFERLSIVSKTEEIASLTPTSSQERDAQIAALCRSISASTQASSGGTLLDYQRLKQEVTRAQDLLARELPYESPAAAQLGRLRKLLASMAPNEATARLTSVQQALQSQAAAQFAPLRAIAHPAPPHLDDLPQEVRDRFVGKSGTFLLKVFARGNIWNMHELEQFVRAVESVDPRVTGHPVQTYYASRHMQASYIRAGLYALAAVLVLLWIDFRSLAHSLLAMVPLALGFVQMCGLFGWLNLPLNPANMIVLPLLLGIGVDHGVHLVHFWRQHRGRFELGDATAVAVLLTATTTTASFGALIFARHQGLQSLGQALTLGVTTCLGASIVFFPALLASLRGDQESEVAQTNDDVEAEPSTPDNQCQVPITEYSVPVAELPVTVEEIPVSRTDYSVPHAVQPLTLEPEPVLEAAAVLKPVPVTEEEIAALLESAFSPRLPADPAQPHSSEDSTPSATPRRRNLPRRSEAA